MAGEVAGENFDIEQYELKLDRPLVSIFSRVHTREGEPAIEKTYVPRAVLRLEREIIFPRTSLDEAQTHQGIDPVEALKQECTDMRDLPAHIELERLYYALQRYAWCLPSPLEAVSLYDFARTHAAVAAALDTASEEMFLLGGDVSGVQDFIYTLTADGATKQLRGRSFYLQLLTEACAWYLLQAAGLPLTNLLYAGGGHLYILLPSMIEGIPAAEWLIDQRSVLGLYLLRQHQGALYLALGGARLGPEDMHPPERFRDAWGAVNEDIARDKRRRFADIGVAGLQELFAPQGQGGDEEDACVVCGYHSSGDCDHWELLAPQHPDVWGSNNLILVRGLRLPPRARETERLSLFE